MAVADQAFVTLGSDDDYCQGALVLGQSLRNHVTSRKLAILITPQVSSVMRAVLCSVFDEVIEVDEIYSADSVHLSLLERPELSVTFTKLHCWTLTQYSKCVFMDADTLVLCNIDELFEREELSAAPDSGWPDCFNSGVFVFRPSLQTYNYLLQFATEHGSFDGGDQGLLNSFFSNWATTDIGKHLPFIYNLSSSAIYTYVPAFKQCKGRSFLGSTKPWHYTYNPQTRTIMHDGATSGSPNQFSFLQLWWKIYYANILPLLEKLQEMANSESQGQKHVFYNDEIRLKNETPLVINSLQIPTFLEQTSEMDITASTPEEFDDKTTPVEPQVEQQSSEVHLPEPNEPLEQPVFHPAAQQSLKLDETTHHISELSIPPEPEAPNAEDERKKWEEGHIDYMGKDAFEHIKRKLDTFLK